MGFYNENFAENLGTHYFDNDVLSIFSENEIEVSMIVHSDDTVIIDTAQLLLLPDAIQTSVLPFERVPGGRRV
jgi:hypothetical protein